MKRIFEIINRVLNRVFKILKSENFLMFAMVFCIVASIYFLLTALGLSEGIFQRVWNQSEIWKRVTLSISFVIGGYILWSLRVIVRYRRTVKETPLRFELNQIREELEAIKKTV